MGNKTHHIDTSLKKEQRLRKRKDFTRLFEHGQAFRGKNLDCYVYPNSLDFSRLGIVTSRKVGNAVVRNRIRRLLRECFRMNKALLGPGLDVVFIPRKGFPTSFTEVEGEFKRLVSRLKVRKAR